MSAGLKMKDELKEYDLHVELGNDPDEPIDFKICDKDGEAWATVWGSRPTQDVQIECEHPAVEFDDDETVGECPICGATCTWHWHVSADDGYTIKERIPDQWEKPKEIGGIVGKYLKDLSTRW